MVIISVLILVFLMLLFLSGLIYFYNQNKIAKTIQELYAQLYNKLPLGVLAFNQDYEIITANHFLQEKFQESGLENIYDFINMNKLEQALNAEQKKIELELLDKNYSVYFYKMPIKESFIYFAVFQSLPQEHQGSKAIRMIALGLAHELKNPITSLKTLLQMANGEHKKDLIEKFASIFNLEVDRLDKVINDFLMYSDADQLNYEHHNLNEIVMQAEQIIYKNYPQSSIKIKKNLYPVPKIKLDKKKILQALLNFIVNSMEAMPEYGGGIEITSKKKDNHLELSIKDDGKGVAPEDQDKITLPFYTTKQDGPGLGLSIAEKIINNHQGSLTFESIPSVGTTFRIILPLIAK
jgi:signal transduction histidine kinase